MNLHKTQRRPVSGLVIFNSMLMVTFILGFIFLTHRAAVQTVQAVEGGHSHFRFGHITWEEAESSGSNTAQITFTAGFRRSGFECWDPLSETVVACSAPDELPGREMGG